LNRANRQSGWEVQRAPDGTVIQSGFQRRPANNHHDVSSVDGWITRGVILQTYYADEDDRNGWVKGLQRSMLSDVRTYGRYSRTLTRVPHAQRTHGLFDEDFRTPRSSTQNINGGDLLSEPSGSKGPTSADKIDGDHVLIGFLDNDPMQPVILPFSLPHPSAAYTPQKADGRVKRMRHSGVLMEWDSVGNFTLDARGAAKQELVNGAEQSNSGTAGKVTFRTTDGSNETSIQLNNKGEIHLSSGPGTGDEPVPLGNVIKDIMGMVFQALATMQVGTAVGPSSPPLNIAQFQVQFDRFAADEHSSDFVFVRKAH
jgi:hypothetical protein